MDKYKWLDDKIYWLTAVTSVNEEQFKKNYNSTYDLYHFFESGKTIEAQKAVDFISKNLNIVAPFLHYDWSGELDHDLNTKGQMSKGQLTISLTFTTDKHALAATTVHELMHYFLMHRKNIVLPDNQENEKITDLVAIVLGLGNIMLNGKVLSIEDRKINTLGYLTLEEIAYAYKKVDSLRNVSDYYHLTYNAKRILDGTIENNSGVNFKSNKYQTQKPYKPISLFTSVKFGFKKILYWLNIASKKTPIFLKNLLSNLYAFTQRKDCPFCHKNISKKSRICKFCKRTLVERR